jgi:hypothetical protein
MVYSQFKLDVCGWNKNFGQQLPMQIEIIQQHRELRNKI